MLQLAVSHPMPGGMNGRQVANAGRAIRPDLKVLFNTSYAENTVLSHGHLNSGIKGPRYRQLDRTPLCQGKSLTWVDFYDC